MDLRRGLVHADRRLHDFRALSRGAIPLVLLPLVLTPIPLSAQTSVEVSPLRVELQTAPGGAATQAVTLTNSGKDAVRVRARVSDWDLSRDGAPQFEGAREGGPYSATSWIRIAPPDQVIDATKDGVVRFSLTVPAGVAPAGYRTSILFEFLPPGADPARRGREVQFRSRIATLIYVNIGQPPVNVELTDLLIRPAKEATQVIATLKNTSKRTVRTKGTLTLSDTAGKTIAQTAVPDVPVLPESEREVAITAFEASKPLPAGEYRVEVKIDVGMPALLVGETTLKVAR
jgi:P pilus assembly chaperone PapD